MWRSFLSALSKGKKEIDMDFHFHYEGWKYMSADWATELGRHFPLNIMELYISYAKFGAKFIKALIERLGECEKLKRLWLNDISYDDVDEGEESGVRLVEAQPTTQSKHSTCDGQIYREIITSSSGEIYS